MFPRPWHRLPWRFPVLMLLGLGAVLLALLWAETGHPWWALGLLLGTGALGVLVWRRRRRDREIRSP